MRSRLFAVLLATGVFLACCIFAVWRFAPRFLFGMDGSVVREATLSWRAVSVGNRSRTYLLYVPRGYSAQKQWPVVLNFHGGSSDASSQVALSAMNRSADTHGFIVIYPRGSGALPSRRTFNAGGCCGFAARHNVDDSAFAMKTVDDVARIVTIDPRRIYATGMSNGAMMAYRLACEHADRIAAVAAVAGVMAVTKCEPSRPVSILHFHGTDDRFVPYEGGTSLGVTYEPVERTIKFWVDRDGCRGNPQLSREEEVECRTYSQCEAGMEVILCTINGGGHTWPGGRPFPVGGRTVHSISASDRMLTFFKSH